LNKKLNLSKNLRMKINRYFAIIGVLCVLSGCKDDPVTESENNNNNQNPNAPELSSPANNSTITDISPDLAWLNFTGAASYRIQVSLDANFAGTIIIDSSLSATSINIPPGSLTTNAYYYWRVIANLQSGVSNWSSVWRFIIILAPPPPPNLLAPPNNSTGVSFTPLFDWNDPPTAESYSIQVSSNPNFIPIAFDSSGLITSTVQCPPYFLITNTQYYWRVNASNSNGASTSAWSTVFNFTTIPGPVPNSISGTITFADTMFLPPPNDYFVGIFNTNNWPPPNFGPNQIDTLDIKLVGNVYQANYIARNLPNGNYYVTCFAGEILLSNNRYLGIYGCDTVHIPFSTCPLNPTVITINNNFGVDNINFLSWADTAKAIF
jgi:hypothetical protein